MTAPALTAQIQGQGAVSADNLNTYEQTCDTISELRGFIGLTGIQVFVRGTNTPNDGGGGPFFWSASAIGPDNGVSVVVPTGSGSGCWIRLTIFNNGVYISPSVFGSVPNGQTGTPTDNYVTLQAWLTYLETATALNGSSVGGIWDGFYGSSKPLTMGNPATASFRNASGAGVGAGLIVGLSRLGCGPVAIQGSYAWQPTDYVIGRNNLVGFTYDTWCVRTNGYAYQGIDISWVGSAGSTNNGIYRDIAVDGSLFFGNVVPTLGHNLNQVHDSELTGVYERGTPQTGYGITMIGTGGAFQVTDLDTTGRLKIACQNAALINPLIFGGVEVTAAAENNITFVGGQIFANTNTNVVVNSTATGVPGTNGLQFIGTDLLNGAGPVFSGLFGFGANISGGTITATGNLYGTVTTPGGFSPTFNYDLCTINGTIGTTVATRASNSFVNGAFQEKFTNTNQILARNSASTNGLAMDNPSGDFVPLSDNAQNLGGPSNRWAVVYAGTGTINTSDAEQKLLRAEGALTADEIVWAQRIGLPKIFQFNDAIAVKGADKARMHVGYMAQDVLAAASGLNIDPWSYAFLCRDSFPARERIVLPAISAVVRPAKPAVVDNAGNVIRPATDEITVLQASPERIIQESSPARDQFGLRYQELILFLHAAGVL